MDGNWRRKVAFALTLIIMVPLLLAIGLYLTGTPALSHVVEYAKLIIEIVAEDSQRKENNLALLSQIQWDYHQLQTQFTEKICESKGINDKGYLWLTTFVNDEYAVPAIVLGHSLKTLSCVKNMMAFASDEVSMATRASLTKVGWTVQIVTPMDCRWMQRKLRHESTSKGIKGTHTRFHAWNYTQYSKIIYVDPDYMPLSNIDELFEVKSDFAASYCARPGMVDTCFNAGLIVFRPDTNDYHSIMSMWETMTGANTCPHDQLLLYYHYAFHGRWKPLPFAYNVRRIIHYPMKAFHFVCCPPNKPWRSKCRPSRAEARGFDQGITNLRQVSLVYWKKLYHALKIYDIDEWWRSTKYFNAEMEFGEHLYQDCWTG